VIHSGIYYEPDSLKARLCVDGALQMYAFCDEHAIDFSRCGKLIIARSEDELPRLDELERRGRANGVAGLRRVVSGGIPEIEPNAVGVALRLKRTEQPVVKGMIYLVSDPDLPFPGVHITPIIDGDVLLGPTALPVASRTAYRLGALDLRDAARTLTWPGSWRAARRLWRTGLSEVQMAASRKAFVTACTAYVPSLSTSDLGGTTMAGVRAQAVGRDGRLVDDFVIEQRGSVAYVRNAPSPAATSAFALAAEIVGRLESRG